MICYPHSLGFATWSHKPTGLFYGPWTGESEIMKKKLPAGYVGGFPFFAHESHHEFWWSSSHSFQKSQHILTVCWKNLKKKTYFPIPGIPSRLAGNIHPGFDDFPTSTMPRRGRVPGHHRSSQGWPVCCLQQLQGLLPAADVDPGETSQRSTVSVESQSENHLTLGQNMSK